MAEYPESLQHLVGDEIYDPRHIGVRAKGESFDIQKDAYSKFERFLIHEHFARSVNAGYASIPNLMKKYPDPEQDELLEAEIAEALMAHGGDLAILDGTHCISDSIEDSMNVYAVAQNIGFIARKQIEQGHGDAIPKRIVLPITLGLPKGNEQDSQHLGTIVLEFDPTLGEYGHFTISCFEPIGHVDGQKDDYSEYWAHIGAVMHAAFEEIGFTSQCTSNIAPYYEGRRNACQNVGIEAMKTLCMTEKLITDHLFDAEDLYMIDADIDKTHAANVRLIQRIEQAEGVQTDELGR
jgi:hypothetical protein